MDANSNPESGNASISGYRPRLENVHQGFHPFLDQINQKDSLCLINELCLLHRIKPEYELIDVQGPEHSKVFTGVSEKHHGQGSSIRAAQRDAAKIALQKTRLKFPARIKSKGPNCGNRFSPMKIEDNAGKSCNNWNNFPIPNVPMFAQFNRVNYHAPIVIPSYAMRPNINLLPFPVNSNPRFFFDPLLHKQYLVYELNPPPNPLSFFAPTVFKDNVQMESRTDDANCRLQSSREAKHPTGEESSLEHLKNSLLKMMKNSSNQENPVLLVQNLARNNISVKFDLIDSWGPVHSPTFRYSCSLIDSPSGQSLFEAQGEDRSKKLAKKQAALNILKEIGNSSSNIVAENVQPGTRPETDRIQDSNYSVRDLDLISNKVVTILFDLARNMSIPDPIFSIQKINNDNPIVGSHNKALKLETSYIYRMETILFLDRNDPEQKSIHSIKAFGFGLTRRMAKRISVSILLLRMGIGIDRIDPNNQPFYHSFQFSLVENSNLFKQILPETQEQLVQHSREFIENPKFHINYQFVLFILKKFYHYTLKDSRKHCGIIVDKFRFLLPNFKQNFPMEFEHFDEESIQEMISLLNLETYWDHLRLISGLLTLGIQEDPAMAFQDRICLTDSEIMVSFISVRLNKNLNRENFVLINKHYVTYGLGTDADAAREAASLKVLHHMASNSMQHFIRIKSNDLNQGEQKPELELASSSSKPSRNQKKSKQCLTIMYDVCRDLFTHKPEVVYFDWKEPIDGQELQGCTCTVTFKQKSGKRSASLKISSLSTGKRLSRTISAYMVLSILNISQQSLVKLNVFSIPDFEKYLKYSIKHDMISGNHLKSIRTCASSLIASTDTAHQSAEMTEEIERNMNFLKNILQEIYQSHLKNQKRSDPSCLLAKLEDKLFEYHNHRKQILDQGDSFDRWSDHVRKWINESFSKFDGSKYWDHLRLLSLIGSTLNTDLDHVLDPLVFEFKCKLIQTELEPQTQNQDSGYIAIITVQSASEAFIDRFVMLRKEFLSFSLDHDQNEARELASYKALRYLAINLWKSSLDG